MKYALFEGLLARLVFASSRPRFSTNLPTNLPMNLPLKRSVVLLAFGAICHTAAAQEAAATAEDETIEEVVVRAHHALSADGWARPTDVMLGDELHQKAADNIGETLAREPGVHSASFGPAVGRPVIHGLDGARVRVLEDDIDAMDVSITSGDHVVSIDPFIADTIDVIKGAGTLLYGTNAIGGVVDVHTGRIPHSVPDQLTGKLDVRATDNADGRRAAVRIDGGGGNVAWHFDAARRSANDIEIPGFAESALWRALEEAEHDDHDEDAHHDEEEGDDHDDDEAHDEDHDEHEDEHEEPAYGVLEGSHLEATTGAFGISFTGERGLFGVAVSHFATDYGVPVHGEHADEEEHEDEHEEHGEEDEHGEDDHDDAEDDHDHEDEHDEHGLPVINLEQTRVAVEANLNDPMPGLRSLNLHFAINDYEHAEGEAGEVGTRFINDAWEARAELRHDEIGGFEGVFGTQLSRRDFAAIGEETLSPPSVTNAWGVFWVGQKDFEGLQLEAGLRYDQVRHEADGFADESFGGASMSLGAVVPLDDDWTASALVDYASRAPVVEELYSEGPHLATNSFDIGDPDLDSETAFNLSATLGYSGEKWSALATAYYTSFDGFIHQVDPGTIMDGLPVRQFTQRDATFAGFEAEASVVAAQWSGGQWTMNAFYDRVAAELDGPDDRPPRLPPDRVGLGTAIDHGAFSAAVDYMRVSDQDETASFELPTEGYDDLRARLAWDVEAGRANVRLYVQGRNLTDAEQRHHTSFVKDQAPAPGRTLEAGIRVLF